MNTPEEQLYLDSVIADPVRKALKRQLKDLGWRLYRLLGNTNAMLEIAEEIAKMKRRRWNARSNIIDKNWDGIGIGNDVWVA